MSSEHITRNSNVTTMYTYRIILQLVFLYLLFSICLEFSELCTTRYNLNSEMTALVLVRMREMALAVIFKTSSEMSSYSSMTGAMWSFGISLHAALTITSKCSQDGELRRCKLAVNCWSHCRILFLSKNIYRFRLMFLTPKEMFFRQRCSQVFSDALKTEWSVAHCPKGSRGGRNNMDKVNMESKLNQKGAKTSQGMKKASEKKGHRHDLGHMFKEPLPTLGSGVLNLFSGWVGSGCAGGAGGAGVG